MIIKNNLFKISKNYFSYNLFLPKFNSSFLNLSYKLFSTNKVNEKESLELVEAGVFEILKSAAKCKHDKLNRTVTLEELGISTLNKGSIV